MDKFCLWHEFLNSGLVNSRPSVMNSPPGVANFQLGHSNPGLCLANLRALKTPFPTYILIDCSGNRRLLRESETAETLQEHSDEAAWHSPAESVRLKRKSMACQGIGFFQWHHEFLPVKRPLKQLLVKYFTIHDTCHLQSYDIHVLSKT